MKDQINLMVVDASFEIVMSNMSVEDFTKKAFEYSKMPEAIKQAKSEKIIFGKAYNALSIWRKEKGFREMEIEQSAAYSASLLKSLDE